MCSTIASPSSESSKLVRKKGKHVLVGILIAGSFQEAADTLKSCDALLIAGCDRGLVRDFHPGRCCLGLRLLCTAGLHLGGYSQSAQLCTKWQSGQYSGLWKLLMMREGFGMTRCRLNKSQEFYGTNPHLKQGYPLLCQHQPQSRRHRTHCFHIRTHNSEYNG